MRLCCGTLDGSPSSTRILSRSALVQYHIVGVFLKAAYTRRVERFPNFLGIFIQTGLLQPTDT